VAAEGVEDVGGAGEVEDKLGRAGVRHAFDLRCWKVDHCCSIARLTSLTSKWIVGKKRDALGWRSLLVSPGR
jgi:hypothetical protein